MSLKRSVLKFSPGVMRDEERESDDTETLIYSSIVNLFHYSACQHAAQRFISLCIFGLLLPRSSSCFTFVLCRCTRVFAGNRRRRRRRRRGDARKTISPVTNSKLSLAIGGVNCETAHKLLKVLLLPRTFLPLVAQYTHTPRRQADHLNCI